MPAARCLIVYAIVSSDRCKEDQEDVREMTRKISYIAAAVGCAAFLGGFAFSSSAAAAQPSSDSVVTQRVMGKLSVDDPEVARMVKVSTKDGVVTIDGMTYTASQEAKVLRDARSVKGVVKVQNRMSIEN